MNSVLRPGWKRWGGYLLYALALVAVLLWLLFPREQLRRALTAQLSAWSPALAWRVGEVTLGWPLEMRVDRVEGVARGGDRVLVRLERVVLWPEWRASWRNHCLQGGFRVALGQGGLTGSLQRYASGPVAWVVRARGEGIDLADWPLVGARLNRDVQGRLDGTCTLAGAAAGGRLDHVVAELRVVQGRLGVQQRLLGYRFFPFSQATVKVFGQGRRWEIADGVAQSDQFRCEFSGVLTGGAENLLDSTLDLRGVLWPGSGFFQNGERSLAVRVLRARMRDNALPFRISGALSQPGIHFGELGPFLKTLEEELR